MSQMAIIRTEISDDGRYRYHFIFFVKIISLNLIRLNNELQWHIVKPSGSGSGDISSNPSRGEYIYNFYVLFQLGICVVVSVQM